MKRPLLSIAALLLLAFSSTAILAQSTTETPAPSAGETATVIPPPVFTDGRINGSIDLGGLALYCVDQSGNNVNAIDNGFITVWGVGDQKYINLDANQLRGNVEIPQLPATMQMTQEATEDTTVMEVTPMVAVSSEEPQAAATPAAQPVLLARAATPNGEIGFFGLGNDQFALQGYDENGKFFTYTWTGCSTGVIDTTSAAYMPDVTTPPTAMMTPEMTAEATTSP